MNTTSIMDKSRVKPIVKKLKKIKNKNRPHNDRKETNIHSPKNPC